MGRDKSFVYDLNKEQGIVRMRVAFVPRSAEIQPLFWRFVTFIPPPPTTIQQPPTKLHSILAPLQNTHTHTPQFLLTTTTTLLVDAAKVMTSW